MKSTEKAVFEIILITAVIFAIALLPHVANACSQQTHTPPPFTDFDKNDDGLVSEEEFNATKAARMASMAESGKPMKGAATAPVFNDLDMDGDGMLSEAELSAGQQAHMQAMRAQHEDHSAGKGMGKGMNMPTFVDIDADGNECISAEEFAAHQASHHRPTIDHSD